MRFNLILERTGKRNFLPFNYQYEISSWIYKLISVADADFSRFLHEDAYKVKGKKFKLFTFSNPDLRPFKIHKEYQRIEVCGDSISMQISFLIDQAAESFIKGLFLDQVCSIGDKISTVDFVVSRIEAVAPPLFQEKMVYRTLSPICVSLQGEKYAQYIDPKHPEYGKLLVGNLVEKLKAVPEGAQERGPGLASASQGYNFNPLTPGTSRLITIKSFTEQQTKIRGFDFRFELMAPPLLHEIGYYSGFGEKNSTGFGCVDVV